MAKKKQEDMSIAYQSKDVASKVMADKFRGKTFAVYGIDVPEIVEARPTNLPAIEANELRLDNLFLLKDGSYAIVDYESRYMEENKVDYLKYLARVTERLYNDLKRFVPIRLIIIYTADVEAGTTEPTLDLGGIKIEITEAFLSAFDSNEIWNDVSHKIKNRIRLTDEDVMRLIIYPMTYRGKDAKTDAVERAIRLANEIEDEDTSIFVLKLILTFSDKFISKRDSERIKEEITMTKVEKLLADEIEEKLEKRMREEVDLAVDKAVADTKESVTKSVTKSVTTNVAGNMLRSGIPADKVSEITGLSKASVKRLMNTIKNDEKLVAVL